MLAAVGGPDCNSWTYPRFDASGALRPALSGRDNVPQERGGSDSDSVSGTEGQVLHLPRHNNAPENEKAGRSRRDHP